MSVFFILMILIVFAIIVYYRNTPEVRQLDNEKPVEKPLPSLREVNDQAWEREWRDIFAFEERFARETQLDRQYPSIDDIRNSRVLHRLMANNTFFIPGIHERVHVSPIEVRTMRGGGEVVRQIDQSYTRVKPEVTHALRDDTPLPTRAGSMMLIPLAKGSPLDIAIHLNKNPYEDQLIFRELSDVEDQQTKTLRKLSQLWDEGNRDTIQTHTQ